MTPGKHYCCAFLAGPLPSVVFARVLEGFSPMKSVTCFLLVFLINVSPLAPSSQSTNFLKVLC